MASKKTPKRWLKYWRRKVRNVTRKQYERLVGCCPAAEFESADEPGLVVEQVLKAALSRLHSKPAIRYVPYVAVTSNSIKELVENPKTPTDAPLP